MPHLSLEALARLLDEPPTNAESRHLECCAHCREELEALHADQAALGELPDLLPPPPGAWAALEERLREEGLVGTGTRTKASQPGARFLRLAASLALFLCGGISGFLLRGDTEQVPGEIAARTEATSGITPIGSSLGGNSSLSATPSGTPRPGGPTLGGGLLTSASNRTATIRDAAAAARALQEAELAYRAALDRYAEFSSEDQGANPMMRLAALENIVITTRDALAAAPADPLINGYHMAALAQRDATVRQIALSSNERWY